MFLSLLLETLRAIVILAEMPLFTNFSVYAPMTQKFTEGIVSLPEDAVNVLKVGRLQ